MKKIASYLMLVSMLVVFGGLFSCYGPPATQTDFLQASAKGVVKLPRGPEDLNAKLEEAWNAGNIDSVVDFWEVGAAVQPGYGSEYIWVNEDRSNLRAMLSGLVPGTLLDLPITHMISNGEVALMHSIWKMTSAADGTVLGGGFCTTVERKQADGTWRVVIDIFDDDYANSGGLPIPAELQLSEDEFMAFYNSDDLEGCMSTYEHQADRPNILNAVAQEYPSAVILDDFEDLRAVYALYLAGGELAPYEIVKWAMNAQGDIALLHSHWDIPSDGYFGQIATEIIHKQPEGDWDFVNDIFDDRRMYYETP